MDSRKITTIAVALAAIAAALIISGCSGTVTPSPTPAPTPAPTVTPSPAPSLSPVDKEYQFVERLYTGVDDYNAAVGFVNTAKDLNSSSDYANASKYMGMAGDRMGVAANDFRAMLPYATTEQEITLSQKWIDAAENYAKSYQNASSAYAELAYQKSRPTPNYVKYDNYVQQANQYNVIAEQSRKQADAIMGNITFVVPTQVPHP